MRRWPIVTVIVLLLALAAAGQETPPANPGQAMPPDTQAYKPKFPGDPAHSDAEAVALAYMRTIVRAETEYHKKHDAYTTSLATLAGHGSFTKRMINPNRGDYTAHFKSNGKQFTLEMVPKQYDAQHRAFYVNELGVIRGEEDKPATEDSPPVKSGK
jgi:hypothetical protein